MSYSALLILGNPGSSFGGTNWTIRDRRQQSLRLSAYHLRKSTVAFMQPGNTRCLTRVPLSPCSRSVTG